MKGTTNVIQHLTKKRDEEGFTLIELLVVIVILGILAAVVVFAVGGITDKGQNDACKTDTRTMRTAQEAYYAKNSTYSDEAGLVTAKLLTQQSTLHDITTSGTGTAMTYNVTIQDTKCGGSVGNTVNGTSIF